MALRQIESTCHTHRPFFMAKGPLAVGSMPRLAISPWEA
jgi:hypothetical protein